MLEIICRKYSATDRASVRTIAWETAFMGEPGEIFFSDKELLADFLSLYFTDYEPESCYVAEADAQIVGYLIGAKDKKRLERVFKYRVLPVLLAKFVFQGVFFKKKNLKFIFYLLRSLFRGEFRAQDPSSAYPAVLHINIRAPFRNLSIGARLIAAYLDDLKRQGVSGVSLATMSEKAKGFFLNQGFKLVGQYPRSYFRYLLSRDITVGIYAKKLAE